MIDSIKLRKIRYDVVEELELQDLIRKIENALAIKESYKDDISLLTDLQREANLDLSKNTYDDIILQLETFVSDCNNVESLRHLPSLDYIDDCIEGNDEEEAYLIEENLNILQIFILQFMQVKKLQEKIIESSRDIFYIGDDNKVYDIATDKPIIDAKILGLDLAIATKEEVSDKAVEYIINTVVQKQRKYIMTLDFDEEGFFISQNGENMFTDNEKLAIKKDAEEYIKHIVGEEFFEEQESDSGESVVNEDDIFDDVGID